MSSVDFVCSEEQAALVEQVREQTGSTEPQHVLMRFLVARDWDTGAAVKQLAATMRWREEHKVDQHRRPTQGLCGKDTSAWLSSRPDGHLVVGGVELWPALRQMVLGNHEGAWIFFGSPPTFFGAAACHALLLRLKCCLLGGPCMALGHDKQGRPIHLQRAGVASGKRMAEACAYFGREWQQAFMSRNIFFQELQAARMEDATQRFGHLVTQQVVIMDMAGMSFRPDQRALTIFRDFAGMMSRNYPETLYKQFIINAPRVFSAIWRIVRVWLDPNTREKVRYVWRRQSFSTVAQAHSSPPTHLLLSPDAGARTGFHLCFNAAAAH